MSTSNPPSVDRPNLGSLTAGLRDALENALGFRPLSVATVLEYREAGWTGAFVEQIMQLAEFAVARGTVIDPKATITEGEGTVREAYRTLSRFVDYLTTRGALSLTDALPWVAVVAATPLNHPDLPRSGGGPSPTLAVRRLVSRMPAGVHTREVAKSQMARWHQAVPAQLAALAWMAGFTPDEAATGYQQGDLEPCGLALLAALRGYLVPPLLAESR